MRIDSSNITIKAETSLIATYSMEEKLEIWPMQQGILPDGKAIQDSVTLQLQDQQQQLKQLVYPKPQPIKKTEETKDIQISEEDQRKIELLQQMLEWLTGKKINFKVFDGLKLKQNTSIEPSESPLNQNQPIQPGTGGMHYLKTEKQSEVQTFKMSALGKIVNDTGQSYAFDFNVAFASEKTQEKRLEIKLGEALKDPLVIHLNETIPSLNNQTLLFDLFSNGDKIKLPFYNGSGYLVYDKNKDGIVNNGQELFGPVSNKGFEELSQYDDDSNGWIDENDALFKNLSIWTVDQDGNTALQGLLDKDVGAIYLGNVSSGLKLYDDSQIHKGNMSQAGIYLKESGGVSMISQVDLKI